MAPRSIVDLDHLTSKDRLDIDQQVERILEHPLFRHSKRLPVFLRYIVRESLSQYGEGPAKERTLGIEVFGRKPDYDNNSDPIVRVTATELRKKLAQYYFEDGHNDEIRIELPPGAYLPKFRRSRTEETVKVDSTSAPKTLAITPAIAKLSADVPEEFPVQSAQLASTSNSKVSIKLILGSVACLILIAVVTAYISRMWRSTHVPLDDFWIYLAKNSDRVLIVMPVIGSDNIKTSDIESRSISVSPNLSLEDTNIAVHVAGQLERHNTHYQLVSSAETSFDELRTNPSVLIGALDNIWTMRLMQNLPYVFEEAPDHRTGRILDSSSGGRRSWSVDIDMLHTHITHDYGIVARYTNRVTGQPIVVLAGISSQGTQAAGELLTSSEFESINPLVSRASNFEVVIETEAIDGHAGHPHIVASKVW